jgi:hypothetical protein
MTTQPGKTDFTIDTSIFRDDADTALMNSARVWPSPSASSRAIRSSLGFYVLEEDEREPKLRKIDLMMLPAQAANLAAALLQALARRKDVECNVSVRDPSVGREVEDDELLN